LQDQNDAFLEGLQHMAPQERIAQVQPYWETLSADARAALLSIDLSDLKAHAERQAARLRRQIEAEALEAGQPLDLSLDPPLDAVLEEGLSRSRKSGTWKEWRWPGVSGEEERRFLDSDSFRQFLEELLDKELRQLLPRDPEGSKPMERPAEAGLRQRM
jgi:hypothetical protein